MVINEDVFKTFSKFMKGYTNVLSEGRLEGLLEPVEGRDALNFSGFEYLCESAYGGPDARRREPDASVAEFPVDGPNRKRTKGNSVSGVTSSAGDQVHKRRKPGVRTGPTNRETKNQIVYWAFQTLSWNLMTRSVSTADILYQHISWINDSLTVVIPKHKSMHNLRYFYCLSDIIYMQQVTKRGVEASVVMFMRIRIIPVSAQYYRWRCWCSLKVVLNKSLCCFPKTQTRRFLNG
jgi:hypothetical protein